MRGNTYLYNVILTLNACRVNYKIFWIYFLEIAAIAASGAAAGAGAAAKRGGVSTIALGEGREGGEHALSTIMATSAGSLLVTLTYRTQQFEL